MNTHTPGPWSYVIEAGGNRAILDSQGRAFQSDEKYYPWVSKNAADWHLIAAAPELLALLVESQESIGGDWRERRDALILKATGGQP